MDPMAAGTGIVPDSRWLTIISEVEVDNRYSETTCYSSDTDMFESIRVRTACRT
jgi:hypothetical protein